MAKTTKKRIGRPEGRKPLLNLRVDQDLHAAIKAAAVKAGRTVAEESVHRLRLSFSIEKQHAEMLQAEFEARCKAEDDLAAAHALIEKLELLKLNVADDIVKGIAAAFARAGFEVVAKDKG